MNNLRLGVDFSNGEILAALMESSDSTHRIIALGRFSCGEPLPDSFGPKTAPTIAMPDRQSIVRVVQIAPVEASMAEQAARFELTSSFLESEAEFRTVASPIAPEKKDTDTPDRWLTAAVRRARLDKTETRLFGEGRRPNIAQFTTRSIALGAGFLRFCELPAELAVVVVSPSVDSTSVCFLSGGCIVGAADLRGWPNDQNSSREITGWLSELQTLIQFRLGTDLAASYPGSNPPLILAADEEIANRLAGHSSMPATPAVLKTEYRTASVDGTPVSLSWLVALGAAVN